MAYNRETEATLVIDREHHKMLKELADKNKRKLRAMTESIIEEAHKAEFKR